MDLNSPHHLLVDLADDKRQRFLDEAAERRAVRRSRPRTRPVTPRRLTRLAKRLHLIGA